MDVVLAACGGKMFLAGGIVVSVLETAIILKIWKTYGIISELSKEKKNAVMVLMIGISVLLNCFLFQNQKELTDSINSIVVYTLLAGISGIDLKEKKIPNKLLLAGLVIRTGIILLECMIHSSEVKRILFYSVAGFLFGLVFLFILCMISRQGIGYGDVKLFAWLGYCVGIWDTYNILFYSALFTACVGLFLVLVKKQSKKTEIPFGPFVFMGTYLVLFMKYFTP